MSVFAFGGDLHPLGHAKAHLKIVARDLVQTLKIHKLALQPATSDGFALHHDSRDTLARSHQQRSWMMETCNLSGGGAQDPHRKGIFVRPPAIVAYASVVGATKSPAHVTTIVLWGLESMPIRRETG